MLYDYINKRMRGTFVAARLSEAFVPTQSLDQPPY